MAIVSNPPVHSRTDSASETHVQRDAADTSGLPAEPVLPPGVTWRQILQILDIYATRSADRWQWRIPREEFISAGHLAIAQLLATSYPTTAKPFYAQLRGYLKIALAHTVCEEWGHKRKDGTYTRASTYTTPLQLVHQATIPARQASTETHAYVQEILAYLQQHQHTAQLGILPWYGAGFAAGEIAVQLGLSGKTVNGRVVKGRRQLSVWAGVDSQPLRRQGTALSAHTRSRIAALATAGLSVRDIAKRVGCRPSTVRRLLSQEERTAIPSLAAAD